MFLDSEKAKSNYIASLISIAYFSNWARAFSLHSTGLVGHTWSLSIEEQFYIIWPILLLMSLRFLNKRRLIVAFALAIAVFVWIVRFYLHANGATPERLYHGLDTRADALMIGCALGVAMASGLLTENIIRCLSKVLVVIAPISALCLLVFSTTASWHDPYMYQFGFFLVELLAVTLIVDILINDKSTIRKLLGMRWLVWVGTISYGLYLWNFPVLGIMSYLGFDRFFISTIGSLITFLVATFSYYLLEKPILRLKKLFYSQSA